MIHKENNMKYTPTGLPTREALSETEVWTWKKGRKGLAKVKTVRRVYKKGD
jgi:hypothetical protein